ncbi:unnamed protein product [Echinostoma caproni]|uniref:SAC domain-containing protein n=1 Tax=Echinostoma caproni TaxID=27848 RepID=A0A183B0Y1_9TREM|nr:unnamed protein product [Echinostoma caproni]
MQPMILENSYLTTVTGNMRRSFWVCPTLHCHGTVLAADFRLLIGPTNMDGFNRTVQSQVRISFLLKRKKIRAVYKMGGSNNANINDTQSFQPMSPCPVIEKSDAAHVAWSNYIQASVIEMSSVQS